MRDSTVISIIVPIYNVERYLPKCIESIITQVYPYLEIILVNDGSTDCSGKICDTYAAKDSRIKVIHKDNGGVNSARKAGINIVSGEYVLFVDGDDWIEENRIQNLVENGIQTGAQMIYLSGMYRDFENTSMFCKEDISNQNFDTTTIQQELFPLFLDPEKCFSNKIHWALWMWVIKANLIKNIYPSIPDEIVLGEDQVCVWLCLLNSSKVSLIQESGYHYMQRTTSIMHTKSNAKIENFKYWYKYLKTNLERYALLPKVWQIFNFSAVSMLIQANYELLLNMNRDCLYPFSSIPPHSRIVVYGAGDFGCHLVQALKYNIDYKVVGWVDKGKAGNEILGQKILSPAELDRLIYDFIAIMVMDVYTAEAVKQYLLDVGVDDKKIALMDPMLVKKFCYNFEK